MKRKKPTKRPSIEELEKILENETESLIQILPNGEVRRGKKLDPNKPLTFREDLGGEYAA